MMDYVKDMRLKNGTVGINCSLDINGVSLNSLMNRYWVISIRETGLFLEMYSENREYLEQKIADSNNMFIIDTEPEEAE